MKKLKTDKTTIHLLDSKSIFLVWNTEYNSECWHGKRPGSIFWFRRYAKICDLLVVGLFCDHGAAVAKILLLFSSRVSQKKGVYKKKTRQNTSMA